MKSYLCLPKNINFAIFMGLANLCAIRASKMPKFYKTFFSVWKNILKALKYILVPLWYPDLRELKMTNFWQFKKNSQGTVSGQKKNKNFKDIQRFFIIQRRLFSTIYSKVWSFFFALCLGCSSACNADFHDFFLFRR